MSRDRTAINAKVGLIKSEAEVIDLKNGLWYADDVIAAMDRIERLAREVRREAEIHRGGDR